MSRTQTDAGGVERADALPFPWRALDRTSREEAAALRDLRRRLAGHASADAWRAAAREILGVDVGVVPRRAHPFAPSQLDAGVAVILAPAGEPAGSLARASALVEVERTLAAAVVARALRRRPPAAVDPGWEAPDGVAGAFAAILVASARRALIGDALRVVAAGPAGRLEAAMPRPARDGHGARGDDRDGWMAVSLAVSLDGEAFAARLVVAREAPFAAPPPWDAAALAALGPVPLSIPVVACVTQSSVAEVAALRRGDVLLPGAWPLSLEPGGALTGPLVLASPSSSGLGVRARLVADGRLVLSGEREPPAAADVEMADPSDTALVDAVGDVPVLVRVEVGEARMAAREWASLRPGDVVTLGRRVGEQVLLRVGGVPVARGQLVDVDGEVGVRIDERLTEERTAS